VYFDVTMASLQSHVQSHHATSRSRTSSTSSRQQQQENIIGNGESLDPPIIHSAWDIELGAFFHGLPL
jgi:hypothetical protein